MSECRVPPIFVQDAQAGDPFRVLDDGDGIELTSGGVAHIWRFGEKKWTRRKRASVPRTEDRAREAKHSACLPFPPYAFLCLLLPEAWRRHARFLRGEIAPASFPPIRLTDGAYLWEADRNTRRVSLLAKDGKPLCHVQLRYGFLSASAMDGKLFVLPENGEEEIVIWIRHIGSGACG